jgi:cytochrome b
LVWDLPTRLFHWTLLAAVVSAWVSFELAEALGDATLKWHRVNGLLVLILVVWRLLWGIAGSSTSRFASFVPGPRAVFGYLRGLIAGGGSRFLGHNPAGALMVLALLLVLGVQGAVGLIATDDNDLVGGPLYRLVDAASNAWAAGKHAFLFNYVLLPLIMLHVAANILYGVVKREPLIQAMVTGRKPQGKYADAPAAEIVARPLLRAGVCLIIAVALTLGGILLIGGTLRL